MVFKKEKLMPRVVYNIADNAKDVVLAEMREEKNIVVKERLLAVSIFLDGVQKGKIKKLIHRSSYFVGTWISAYFKGGVEALADNRGCNHSSYCHPLAYFIDNAPWHKTKKVQEYCEENNITLLFFPPYSPEYNPKERVWNFLKSKVKNIYFSTAKKFTDFITDLFQNINETDKNTLLKLCTSLI